MLNEQDMMERLRAVIQTAGSQKAFAVTHKLSQQYISDVLSGRRGVGPRILRAIGLEQVVLYRPLNVATNVADDPKNTHNSAS